MMQQSVKSGLTTDAIANANNAALQMLAESHSSPRALRTYLLPCPSNLLLP
ncbi:hypothetical protein SCAZ3_01160 [Streptococcus canis FSL Z3-227]|uniref:Uncharacterized protein n=1 Tax=Streptococcus canis FSL Z3-227 TaxID=482234 RepID=A0AAV3FQJ3_STRCB|nr:hypothetical protein SCAZ3_01160 [Streptococcus canis FSL Z3-227]